MMHWTKWPYWLRGGIIGLVISLVFVILTETCGYFVTPNPLGVRCILYMIPLFPSIWIVNILGLYRISEVLFDIILVVPYFIIGALIGGIIDLIKNKRAHR
jgi:hypothetical protein